MSLGITATAQTDPAPSEPPSTAAAGSPIEATTEPPQSRSIPHPVFAALTVGGEVGGNYALDTKLSVLGNPFRSGISLGGSAFFAPYTNLASPCTQLCSLTTRLFRGMAELRLGNVYHPDSRSLGWLGLSAGVAYLVEPGMTVSPSAAIAAGGDLRLLRSLWLEASITLTWADMIGPQTPFAGNYLTFGLQLGFRFDLVH